MTDLLHTLTLIEANAIQARRALAEEAEIRHQLATPRLVMLGIAANTPNQAQLAGMAQNANNAARQAISAVLVLASRIQNGPTNGQDAQTAHEAPD